MLTLDADGSLVLTVSLPGAQRVEVVGTFHGYHEQSFAMTEREGGLWELRLQPAPGEHLFRYLIDGTVWLLDGAAHGSRQSARGYEMSRVWIPPRSQDPDAIAA